MEEVDVGALSIGTREGGKAGDQISLSPKLQPS